MMQLWDRKKEDITSDHHFNILKEIDFSKVAIINPGEFISKFL
ncbi:MAG TPA: hypothetical protein VK186_26265 [Candidatus Deferrimicrobium sp.]|nr:hypothetical protein [Candidatus Kapabacteria bacterium]HLP62373.1 hypothetical protein [Candidatus Deferrimicrobium sp.]